MKKNQLTLFLFSTTGILTTLLILIALNTIAGYFKTRIDLTAEKLFTLSDGTKQILKDLDTPIEIRLYATQDNRIMPANYKAHANRVQDLLDEFQAHANNNIQIKKIDPKPDSDAEDLAIADDITGQTLPNNLTDRIYLGLAISMLDKTTTIPFLDPSPAKERHLEYDIARAITQTITDKKPILGILTTLPAFGQPPNPMMPTMPQQNQQPWTLITQLQQDFEVRQIPPTTETIEDDITLLLLIHPKNITQNTEYALDQYILRGGKLLAFLDPLAIIDQQPNPNNPMMPSPPSNSNLTTLLTAWGIQFNNEKVIADMIFGNKQIALRQGQPQIQPSFLFINKQGINQDDTTTAQIEELWLPFPGAFTGTPTEGLQQTTLIHTTPQSQQVDGFMAQFSGPQIAKDFTPENKQHTLALRLTGKFKTAFPDGKPTTDQPDNPDDPLDQPDNPTQNQNQPDQQHLTQSTTDNTITLFGDTDLLHDTFSVRIQNFFGNRLMTILNGNLPLTQNIIEQLAGDDRLIHVRSRAATHRPLIKLHQLQEEAQAQYRSQIKTLENQLQQTQTKLNELQRQRTDNPQGQRFVLSPEQQNELKNFRQQQIDTNKQLKTIRRDMRRAIDATQTRHKWLNIAAMPTLITLIGITIAAINRKKTAAR